MNKSDFPVTIDNEGRRQRLHTAIKLAYGVVAQQHAVVHLVFRYVRLHRLPPIVIHGDADHFKSSRLVLLLEFDKPRDL
jgi:hypothetical protein